MSETSLLSSRLLRHPRPLPTSLIEPILTSDPIRNSSPNSKIKGKLFLASEVGNSRDLPFRILVILSRYSIDLDIVDPIDYDPKDLENESLVVIITSTREGGKPPPNAETLACWLSKEAEDSGGSMRLKRCRFAVFSVGSWSSANAFGRSLVRWMSSLGASSILPLGKGYLHSRHFNNIFLTWNLNLARKLSGLDKEFREEFVEEINTSDDEFGEDNEGCVPINKAIDSEEEILNFIIPDRDANVLTEILATDIPTDLENQPRVMARKASTFFFLLGHTTQHMPNADHLPNDPEAYSVASLYRVEIEHQMEDTTATRSLGLPLFRFTSDKYPLGMGYGIIGCKLFLVGGYFRTPKPTTEDELSPIYYPSNKLYMLDMSSIDGSTTHDDIAKIIEIKDSLYLNKTDPIVVTMDNKIFVFPNNFGATDSINPTIESYDPVKDEWKSFDIFENAYGGSLERCPPSSRFYKVKRYLVEDSGMLIFLDREAYYFVHSTCELYLKVRDSFIESMPPYFGMVLHPNGCFYGLNYTKTRLFAYKELRFCGRFQRGIDSQLSFFLPEFACVYMQGVISSLGGVGGENRLLVVRSGHKGEAYKELNLVCDFLSVMKDVKGYVKCKTYSITYHTNKWDGQCGDIKACFPILERGNAAN